MEKEKYTVVCREREHHLVYQTTNLINNKTYIGVHSTDEIEDGYLGSGWVLKQALSKYGTSAFKRDILAIFSDRRSALQREAELVDQAFVNRHDTYNLVRGGFAALDQFGEKNPMYGRDPHNSKAVKATHKDGRVIFALSFGKLSAEIGIARNNIRNLVTKGIRGKRGWRVELCKDMVCSA